MLYTGLLLIEDKNMTDSIFKKLTLALFFSVLFILPSHLFAEVKIKLIEGKKFSDYQITGNSHKRSLKLLQKDLTKLFSKQAEEYLDSNQNLEIDITNIDLPGVYRYGYGSTDKDIRVLDSSTSYKLYFNFRLLNSSGELLKEGSHKIKDFFDSASIARKNRNRGTVGYYEEEVIKWFKGLSS